MPRRSEQKTCVSCRHYQPQPNAHPDVCLTRSYEQMDWVTGIPVEVHAHCKEFNKDGRCELWERKPGPPGPP
jgi:hypothetical protein